MMKSIHNGKKEMSYRNRCFFHGSSGERGYPEGEGKSRYMQYTPLLLSSIHFLHERSDLAVLQERSKLILALKGAFLFPLTLNAQQRHGINNCGRRGT